MFAKSIKTAPQRPILILIGRAIAIVITHVGERRVDLCVQAPRSLRIDVDSVDHDTCREAVTSAKLEGIERAPAHQR